MIVHALFAGTPQPFGPRGALSSIVKQPVNKLTVRDSGTAEDEQANKKLHGGPEKVIHQYGLESYKRLAHAFPEALPLAVPGGIGENMVVEGMDDHNVCIGDIYQFGGCLLEVSAPRGPCIKIAHKFDIKNLDQFVGKEGITGWYYRVRETGVIKKGDEVSRVFRHADTVSICDLVRATYDESLVDEAKQYAELDVIDNEWRQKCARMVKKFG